MSACATSSFPSRLRSATAPARSSPCCACAPALSDYSAPKGGGPIQCAIGWCASASSASASWRRGRTTICAAAVKEHANRKYAKSWLAICLPVAYCLLDAAGTFADSLVLERLNGTPQATSPMADVPLAAVMCLVYLLARREVHVQAELPKYVGACLRTDTRSTSMRWPMRSTL